MKKGLFTMQIIASVMIASATLGSFNAVAQKEIKYQKIFYYDVNKETDAVSISIVSAVSTDADTKFKIKITNKTNDYIIYKPEESKFVIDGKEIKTQDKWVVIEPNDNGSRVINTKGAYNKTKNYSFVIDGLYRVSTETQPASAPDFKLPAFKNDFKAGYFSCTLSKLNKETAATDVKFNCIYSGDKIGFVFPAKVAVKMPDGNEYANAKSKASTIVLMKKGDEDSFTLHWDRMPNGKADDMQKMDMMIKWNDAFKEAAPEKLKSETIELQFDEAMSNEKGR